MERNGEWVILKYLRCFHKKNDDYKTKYRTTIKEVGVKWYIDRMNAKLPLSIEGEWEKIANQRRRYQGNIS